MQQQSQLPLALTQQLAIGVQQSLQGPRKFDARPCKASGLLLLLLMSCCARGGLLRRRRQKRRQKGASPTQNRLLRASSRKYSTV